MTDKLKVGIVGSGYVARHQHIPKFMKIRNKVDLVAVCDKNKLLATSVATRFGIPNVYDEFSRMISKESLDVVDICVPQNIHAPLAIEAMKQGCHILVEKPMAIKTSQCDRMLETAHKHKVKLSVIHNVLFLPPFLKAKEFVKEGKIGDFIGMRILMSDPKDLMVMRNDYWVHKLPGGLIAETAPHAAYMSLAFLENIQNVEIHAKNFLDHAWAPFDEFVLEIEGEKAISSVIISYASNRHDLRVDIRGTEGTLHLNLSSGLLFYCGEKRSSRPLPFARRFLSTSWQALRGVSSNAFKLATGRLRSGHEIIIERFVDSILNNTQPPVTGEEGRETVWLVERIVERLYEKYAHQLGNRGKTTR